MYIYVCMCVCPCVHSDANPVLSPTGSRSPFTDDYFSDRASDNSELVRSICSNHRQIAVKADTRRAPPLTHSITRVHYADMHAPTQTHVWER